MEVEGKYATEGGVRVGKYGGGRIERLLIGYIRLLIC